MFKSFCFFLLTFLMSCLKDDELTIVRVNNTSNKIKLDGYYFTSDNFGISPIFFYENGIILTWIFVSNKDTLDYNNQFLDKGVTDKIKSWKFSWGLYHIIDNDILMESWYPGEKPYDSFRKKGKIINDTTFILSEFSRPNGRKKELINEIYRFKKFGPKPDSTNVFIK